ncbi:MAG: C cytochrome precursor [Planctomycetes bacterium]|nr:C cytochrome precursor [Planctomycetota bacterium]
MNHGILAAVTVALPALALLTAAVARRKRFAPTAAILLCALCGVATALTIVQRPRPIAERDVTDRPIETPAAGYVTSTTCRACHAREYATWHDSYHRRMTQRASPQAVIGDFDDVTLTRSAETWQLSRDGDDYWIDMPDPVVAPGTRAGRVRRKVSMTTGSHHMQLYWYETGYSRVMGLLPFAFLNQEQRWIPRQAAFIQPYSETVQLETGQWTLVCIKCHATHGRPRADMDQSGLHGADTQVSEFAIACEACHGPAEEHVRANRDPLRRYALHASGEGDPTIVNPARLDHRRSVEVCGQCHGIFDLKLSGKALQDYFVQGMPYRPGDDLSKTRPTTQKGMEEQFWPDGEARVAGREFNGISSSACFQRGDMTCLTCHELHQHTGDTRPRDEWMEDQLHTGDLDATCLRCHQAIAADVPAHTHHEVGSTGSRCDNCHMPYATYGLLKGVRSHRIVSPDVATTLATGRPNACNLCHLDRTLGWTADTLHTWYGTEVPNLDADDRSIAATARDVLKGDAAVRALLAYGLGWQDARAASGQDWIPLYLAELIDDPYEAVRIVATRSLRKLPGFEDLDPDVLGTPEVRSRAKAEILDRWRSTLAAPGDATREPLLIAPDGTVRDELFARLLRRRDQREVRLFE